MKNYLNNTCREEIEMVFQENPGPLSAVEVIHIIYKRHPGKPWKEGTIRAHLIGLSKNHPSGKHYPSLQEHAFLDFLGNGRYKLRNRLETAIVKTTKPANTGIENIVEDVEEIEEEERPDITNAGKVNEIKWMSLVLSLINTKLSEIGQKNLAASQGRKLPYAFEVLAYEDRTPTQKNIIAYETDILIYETIGANEWKPRVVMEGKLGSVTTHDAITYSQKALTHKNVHPYLRYGIILGNRKHYPLPGRLFRHGAFFDFMLSWKAIEPSVDEMNRLIALILEEVEASRNLDEILYNSRNPNRARYTLLHRPLKLG